MLLPGYVQGGLDVVERVAGVPVVRGPRDLRRLGEFFGHEPTTADYGRYDIEIIAEINHAPQLPLDAIVAEADRLRADGADVIDVGCDPGRTVVRRWRCGRARWSSGGIASRSTA